MTPAQLDSIEAALGLKLPETYRKTSIEFPFVPVGRDPVFWFFDEPESVIWETRSPMNDSGYDRANWRSGFVAIGRSAAGDVYLLDTAVDQSPVFCLSHETHAIEVDYTSLEEFVREWQQDSSDADSVQQQQQRAFWRRWRLIMGIVILFMLLFGVLPILVAQWLKPA